MYIVSSNTVQYDMTSIPSFFAINIKNKFYNIEVKLENVQAKKLKKKTVLSRRKLKSPSVHECNLLDTTCLWWISLQNYEGSVFGRKKEGFLLNDEISFQIQQFLFNNVRGLQSLSYF